MGGIAALARSAGHTVSGSDQNVYPPMSTQLNDLGVSLHEGYDAAVLADRPDCVVVGNVMTRGKEVIEALLDSDIPYCSGPQWLAEHVLAKRRVIACAGTHGKTTTASMLAWILEDAGLEPGFLIGGVPQNFGVSARLGRGEFFVVEADEYDTAFFDKRAKFVHYRPEVAVLNNLEFDHADIYANLDAIKTQFHHLIRTVPGKGQVVVNEDSAALDDVLNVGVWTPVTSFGRSQSADVSLAFEATADRALLRTGKEDAIAFDWPYRGDHNLENAAAASAASLAAGLTLPQVANALSRYEGAKRRLEPLGSVAGIDVFDDFAHHPTAIHKTIEGLKKAEPERRLLVALEPRSNTMQSGIHADRLAEALWGADFVVAYAPQSLEFDLRESLAKLEERCQICTSYEEVLTVLLSAAQAGDNLVLMSNGGFGVVRSDLVGALRDRFSESANE